MIFCDSCYVAKCYLAEPDSASVRLLVAAASIRVVSAWSAVEAQAAFHRHLREGRLTLGQYEAISSAFEDDMAVGRWQAVPVTAPLLLRTVRRLRSLPAGVFLRAGDAMQIVSALEAGCDEIWSSDRHLLAACPHFGLEGRTAPTLPGAASI